MNGRLVWIVDGAYMFNTPLGHFDYVKLRAELEKQIKQPIDEGFYLNSTPDPPKDQQNKFHTWLKTARPNGPQLRVQLYGLKNTRAECPSCHNKFNKKVQKGVDVGIATLILKLASQHRYDSLILSAGDGDFEDAIHYVKTELHKTIYISGFKSSLSPDLQSYADRVIFLDDCWGEIQK